MSAVDEKVDAELIEHLDFDSELPCEVMWQVAPTSCGRIASGWIRCKACNFGVCSSRECWIRTVAAATIVEGLGRGVQCRACQATGPFLSLFEFRPLQERS